MEPSNLYVSGHRASFKVITKCSTNLGHFASKVENKMKPRGILCSKDPILSRNPTCHSFCINVEKNVQKLFNSCRHKVMSSYNLVCFLTIVNRIPWE